MPDTHAYLFLRLSPDEKDVEFAVGSECADDAAALVRAEQFSLGKAVEVWKDGYKIAVVVDAEETDEPEAH